STNTRLDCESRCDRASPIAFAGERYYLAAQHGVRSRSRTPCKYRAMLSGRSMAARHFRTFRIAKFPENFRLQGPADLCADKLAHQLRRHQAIRAGSFRE